MREIVPGLVSRTPHVVSVLTNLSAPLPTLERFAALTRGRLGIVSASIHLEFVDVEAFVEKAAAFRRMIDPAARIVVNAVLVPGRLEEVARAREAIEGAGLKFFPQVMKVGKGLFEYDEADRERVDDLVGLGRGRAAVRPRDTNLAPSYRGRLCWSGVDYFVLTQSGDAYSCRTARRFDEGWLGNVLAGTFERWRAPSRCPYDICPCTTPANRGMIGGIAP